MSKDKKDEGTSHYRSGIFVQNVPAKEEKRNGRPTVIREEYRDLHDILVRLSMNVEENTKAIKTLASINQKEVPDKKNLPKTQPAQVKVRVDFLRIIDIDTKHQKFRAEILVHATWVEPESKHRSGKPLWTPALTIINIDGNPEEEKKWSGIKDIPNFKHPLNYACLRMRATFREDLELRQFPVDKQALSIVVSCGLPKSIVTLQEDMAHPSTVFLEGFEDAAEFRLHKHVEVYSTKRSKWDVDQAHLDHYILQFECHVSRKPGYYVINIMFLLFLIVGLVFTTYVLPLYQTKDRLVVSLTILLTTVAFQFKVNSDLPTLSYLTYLGGYILMNMFFLIIHVIEIACIAIASSLYGSDYAQSVDKYTAVAFVLLYLCSNAIYVAVVVITFIRNKNALDFADSEYKRKMQGSRRDEQIYYNEQIDNYLEQNARSHKKKSKKSSVDPEKAYITDDHRKIIVG